MAVSTSVLIDTFSFITFNNVSRVVTWYTSSNLYAGTYNITIKGFITTAAKIYTKTTSFNLYVYNCANSAEIITITTPTGTAAPTS
jgi:hypothetical protein